MRSKEELETLLKYFEETLNVHDDETPLDRVVLSACVAVVKWVLKQPSPELEMMIVACQVIDSLEAQNAKDILN